MPWVRVFDGVNPTLKLVVVLAGMETLTGADVQPAGIARVSVVLTEAAVRLARPTTAVLAVPPIAGSGRLSAVTSSALPGATNSSQSTLNRSPVARCCGRPGRVHSCHPDR